MQTTMWIIFGIVFRRAFIRRKKRAYELKVAFAEKRHLVQHIQIPGK
jgi:hypothetical protein